ncbi:MAG: precorrin-6A reductase [Candidatus Atribacteria bacterium]|nr:precorrin-6A reductase [Candidatus Atribacteria bacterium]
MILVLAGTKDGRSLAESLAGMGFSVLASTVSDYGNSFFSGNVKVRAGELDHDSLQRLLKEKDIQFVIDATHPFAREISQNAIDVCQSEKIKYIRYERKETGNHLYTGLIQVKDFDEAVEKAGSYHSVFLTIGSRNLDRFAILKNQGRKVIARVLPTSEALKKCQELGFLPRDVIAMEGPFSVGLNYYMFKHYQANVVVTKDSGPEGGVYEKMKAAAKLHIPVILVERFRLNYPLLVHKTAELLKEIS